MTTWNHELCWLAPQDTQSDEDYPRGEIDDLPVPLTQDETEDGEPPF